MPRIQLFEFEDLTWFPRSLRNYGTDFLQFLSNKAKMWKPIVPVLQKALKEEGSDHIIDLASGGGGGLLWLNEQLRETNPDLKITLTDYFPNLSAFEFTKMQADNFDYVPEPVNALKVPESLKGLRTQFLSLHHFKPADAQAILQNAVDAGSPIAIFEAQERSLPSILAMIFSPITVLLVTPFIRPFKLGRIIFTYLIPIVPLFVFWDGIVSCLRTYSTKELKSLVDSLENGKKYNWEIERVKSGPGVVIYLLGMPEKG